MKTQTECLNLLRMSLNTMLKTHITSFELWEMLRDREKRKVYLPDINKTQFKDIIIAAKALWEKHGLDINALNIDETGDQ